MTDPTKTRPDWPEGTRASTETTPEPPPPQFVGRYRIERVLGKGSFGVVYLAHDAQLDRRVAVKLPYRTLVSVAEDAEAHLAEARTVAHLDHPNIVPVYDAGSTENCPCFIVTKYIEGQTLAEQLKLALPSVEQAASLTATIAEALHFAHGKGIVHRDIKPGNILLDRHGKPYVVDFGLALKEAKFGEGPRFAGTAAYMSPEQARGEGHRVDGRSDIFSLGVIFYELLTGRRPFKGDSREELREQINAIEPCPPRQLKDTIPRELERICLKALAKRVVERYLTARDMAEDLRLFLAERGGAIGPSAVQTLPLPEDKPLPSGRNAGLPTETSPASSMARTSLSEPVLIVPKGLRSFDAHDADFFLELVPGPRDRTGLPDSIRFWKTFIEERDADNTFPVGLLYGPSGCGKSSLVKAGLLPRLSENVIAVYVEATAEETETRLLNGLRKRCPALDASWSLTETLTALRQGLGAPPGKKMVILLDQFEQWLHAKRGEQGTELVQALRQCDGGRVQCVVLVRDDFWMMVTRFMRELEIRLLEGQNSAAIDLFDADHARKVLAAFGRAFGRLSGETLTREEKEFLRLAVSGLTQEDKIVCVRLALFAETMKGKPWTPASLRAVGGTAGVGATFLEETFSAATAPPEHRLHQKAARAVLMALLPESGASIKGNMRSHDELLQASGYAERPADFEELLRILDSEVRLITPTDPEGGEASGESAPSVPLRRKYYQLAHDYLVPSLRTWLTRKQRETRKGRAELLLADLASVWNARPERRQLPSLPEWIGIRLLTQPRDWSESQRRMMRQADRYQIVRGLAVFLLLAVLGAVGLMIREQVNERNQAQRSVSLVEHLRDADTAKVPEIIKELQHYRRWADPLLREANARAADDSRDKLHSSLALLPVDPSQVSFLHSRLLDATPQDVPVLREALVTHAEELIDPLWRTAEHPPKGKEHQRLRAACALAVYEPQNQRWANIREQVADDLVAVPAVHLALWLDCLRPVSPILLDPLASIFRDTERRETERSLAADILIIYAAEQPRLLVDLLLDANDKQFNQLYAKVREQGDAVGLLQREIEVPLPPDAEEAVKEKRAKRRTNAAAALLRLGRAEPVWPLLQHTPDPRVRSYLIHHLAPLGVDIRVLLERMEEERDLSIQRALLLSLGQYRENALSPREKDPILTRMQDVYSSHSDPGLHAAAEWLLRQWQQQGWLQDMQKKWAEDEKQRDQKLQQIHQELAQKKNADARHWYVNGQGQTMVVLNAPIPFRMGSPPTEPGHRDNEPLHPQRIDRCFAIAAMPVTAAQFHRFRPQADFMLEADRLDPACPCEGIRWYEVAKYCNWLSEKEGIPQREWCYEPLPNGQFNAGMKLAADYLTRMGYRLPTEAEWEYAVRAGADTSRYYGQTEELLSKYAWYRRNSDDHTQPVGRLKPNDFGLFDGLGNVWNLTLSRANKRDPLDPGAIREDRGEERVIEETVRFVIRGGAWQHRSEMLRCAQRGEFTATGISHGIGFRVARTIR